MSSGSVEQQRKRRARAQAKALMEETAQAGTVITYGELAERIEAVSYAPNSRGLTDQLCAISRAENHAGRGMLSAVVIRKDRKKPGTGFFDLAQDLGREYSDEREFWEEELESVYDAWSAFPTQPL